MSVHQGRPLPHIGVSGCNNKGNPFSQQTVLENAALTSGLLDERGFLEGVKVTHKTLVLEQPTRYGNDWFPVGHEIAQALASSDNEHLGSNT